MRTQWISSPSTDHLVLCDWFGVDYPRSERWIGEILDEWNIPEDICHYQRIDVAVAQIVLEGRRTGRGIYPPSVFGGGDAEHRG
jgi:hypothetical protein